MKQVIASIASLIGGVFTALAALFDPTFLLAHPDLALSLGFSILRGGKQLWPSMPWGKFGLVLVAGAIALTIQKIRKRKSEKNP